MNKLLYATLKEELGDLGMSLKDFAKYLGVHEKSVTNWSQADDKMTPDYVDLVIEGLKCKQELKKIKDFVRKSGACED